ncbi:hypothetical protein I6F35_33625 [Bradyrhizobium sp. BRP22]|uniref:hypothetical protein n=1 Tax=Bradyrhizobium sp. BRP22 TaxID=2793821 RepID=UPI001CD31AA2|nr:hypothetical protein [Bradyrhizobium sp. BRP22]MCA1458076.1 hypothetical protein [Bradyrhizobium sp. BRP22]
MLKAIKLQLLIIAGLAGSVVSVSAQLLPATPPFFPFSFPTPVTDFPVAYCDAQLCYTPIHEVHADSGELTMTLDYYPPAGKSFVDVKAGVEIEGGGATHYVNAVSAGAGWLRCKWHARKKIGGDNGLAKGYCWVRMADAAPAKMRYKRR